MNTWWHRLFIVMESALVILGLSAFGFVLASDPVSVPWWGALIALVPAFLMRCLHAVVAYIVRG